MGGGNRREGGREREREEGGNEAERGKDESREGKQCECCCLWH